jgi:hypothetical protein
MGMEILGDVYVNLGSKPPLIVVTMIPLERVKHLHVLTAYPPVIQPLQIILNA